MTPPPRKRLFRIVVSEFVVEADQQTLDYTMGVFDGLCHTYPDLPWIGVYIEPDGSVAYQIAK